MLKKIITVLGIILSIFLVINPVSAQNYLIEVERPIEKEEVRREFEAKGKVVINKKENIKDVILLVSFIRPATWPRYYLQSISKLNFKKKNNNFEAEWTSHCWVGSVSDYGKKFYVYFFLMDTKSLREIQDFNDRAGTEGIVKATFEDIFLNHPEKYFARTESIPIYRKFK